jgi:hypothetical protein
MIHFFNIFPPSLEASVKPKTFRLPVGQLPIYLYAIILFLASLLVTGYAVYTQNQPLQIPLVYLLNNPSLYPNDPFVATLPRYASTLWYAVSWFSGVIPLETLLLILFLFERLLVIYAAGRLAEALLPNSRIAVVGAMATFALAIHPILGAGTIIIDNFEQTGFFIPFLLLATAAFYNYQPLQCAIWLAIGFHLNIMYGTYAITYLGAVFLLDSNYRRAWKKWLPYIGIFLLLSSPAIYITISTLGRYALDNNLWLVATKLRFSHHLYLLVYSKQSLAKFGILIILVLSVLHQNRNKMEKLFKHGTIWAGVSVLWLIYAFVAAYIVKSPTMLVMHPARATDLWYCFAGIALVCACASQIEEGRGKAKQFLLAAVLGIGILMAHDLFKPYVLAVCLIPILWQPGWYYFTGKNNSNRFALLITGFVLFVGLTNFKTRLSNTQSIESALINRPAYSIEQIAEWASTNTKVDAVFLTDPIADLDWEQFRALAKRPVFVTWKDASAILWDRSYIQAWAERINALGLDITEEGLTPNTAKSKLIGLYENLQDEDVKQLQSRFLINYWIVPANHNSKLAIAFQNQSYKVLVLK